MNVMEGDETNVGDREERKRIRAARVMQRLEGGTADANAAAVATEGGNDAKTGQQQIADSMAHIDKTKVNGLERVTQVRVDADETENLRRIEEDRLRQDRLSRLQEEAIQSGKLNAAVEMRWGELLDVNMPQELNDEIETQKNQCSEIIASKDKLIRSFQVQLKDKDEQYIRALKQQAEDVDTLLKAMREEYRTLREEYGEELKQIDDAFLQERDNVLRKNSNELEGLFERRREMELKYLETKQAWEESAKEEIEALQVKDAEEYSKTKVKLETEIQTLEQQLEEMRATYQLNTEKLEYNYRVLTERDAENTATLARLKKQMMRLKDKLHGLVSRYQDMESSERRKNDELTEEYNRITKQYKDLQAKFRHFEMLDNRRYEELFSMHEEEAQDLTRKVLEADRIIHEQFLGYAWQGPVLEQLFNPTTGLAPGGDVAAAEAQLALEEEKRASAEAAATRPKINGEKLRQVLELLAQEAGFLVEKDVREAIESMPAADGEISQAEALLQALGVTDEGALANLIPYFFNTVAPKDEYGAEFATELPLELQEVLISPEHVIKAVRRYVEDRSGAAAELEKAANAGGGDDAANDEEDKNLAGRQAVAARVKAQQEKRDAEAAFWHRLSGVISEPATNSWKALESQMQRYNRMLKDRAEAIEDVDCLKDQNAQLKLLLNQYLGAPVNDELVIPPSQTIRLANGEDTAALIMTGNELN
mmetsp:Transcript_9485/g.27918  ORF Transcript_9485/g.27918 Transcript_9485/m.27918 type:complete len:710 (-) Transcript_9485:100-2229(-)|eukprot:CAMPEP_0118884160 /NCGR_PEP_ID=MMETSP1163-20130328/23075_1 /TAXON_ID=124430 /ORGANISM="Phaeomonas parva, Strain CCMP2877" /LENGTH=709 /DNA_ID=CAMNT_0006821843 /DNA_START=217 /DNA_END=2346 /DNA_ORIENTATION=-